MSSAFAINDPLALWASASIDRFACSMCPKCSTLSTNGSGLSSKITGTGLLLLVFPENRTHFVLLLLGLGSVEKKYIGQFQEKG